MSTAINAAHAFGHDVIGCASTGNLANAVAAHAARAGLEVWIFIPHDVEPAKVLGTSPMEVVYTSNDLFTLLELIPSQDLKVGKTVVGFISHFSRYAVAY